MGGELDLRDTDPRFFGAWRTHSRLDSRKNKLIYLAEKDGIFAAVKVIKDADLMSTDEWEKFALEIKSLKQLDHPNIPKYLDSDLSNSSLPWLATEFVEGTTLQDLVEREGPVDPEKWLSALKDTVDALSYVHSMGIVHRDISPSNIILAKDHAFLIDFGIARRADSMMSTLSIGQAGTPATESPEHLRNSPNPKMDIFSLGSTFTFAGTGHFPFPIDPPSAWIYSILHDFPDLNGLSDLQSMILKPMLYKNSDDRISAEDAVAYLAELRSIADESISEVTPFLHNFLERSDQKLVDVEPLSTSDFSHPSKVRALIRSKVAVVTASIVILSSSLMAWLQTSGDQVIQSQRDIKNPTITTSPQPGISVGNLNSGADDSGPLPTATKKPDGQPAEVHQSNDSKPNVRLSPTPALSSEEFDLSAPLASNVVYDSLFGRPFRSGALYWNIPLQISAEADIPDLTGIQFRPIGFPDGPWLEIPYKLKVSPTVKTVFAQVDEILIALLFKKEVCPEFRVVKEVDGEIVKIWTKGDPECVDDYKP